MRQHGHRLFFLAGGGAPGGGGFAGAARRRSARGGCERHAAGADNGAHMPAAGECRSWCCGARVVGPIDAWRRSFHVAFCMRTITEVHDSHIFGHAQPSVGRPGPHIPCFKADADTTSNPMVSVRAGIVAGGALQELRCQRRRLRPRRGLHHRPAAVQAWSDDRQQSAAGTAAAAHFSVRLCRSPLPSFILRLI